MLKAFNSRALASEKPCINKEDHVPLMHRYLTFHMQDSGQYSINSTAHKSRSLQISERFCLTSSLISDYDSNSASSVDIHLAP